VDVGTRARPWRESCRVHEFETLDEAREVIGARIDGYHQRPCSGLNYRTPAEATQTWDDALGHPHTHAA
jgi:hypothetical protein